MKQEFASQALGVLFAEDTICFDDFITKVEAFDDDTQCAQKILAAITLRDSSGRDQKQTVRRMVATLNVARYEKGVIN